MPSQDFTIGRCGLATAAGGDGLELKCSSFEQSGDECKASGVIRGQSSVADVNALRQQLNGYDLNTDEPVVPVTWVQDPSIDGFYRVQSVELTAEVTGRQKADASGPELAYRWDADLLKVAGGWQAPLFEVVMAGADRANSHAVAPGLGWVAIPATATTYDLNNSGITTSTLVGGGSVRYTANSAYYDDSVVYGVAPSAMYEGAPLLTVNSRTVVGRQAANDPDGWVLANGLVKVRPSLTEANHLVVGVRNNGATDYDEKAYRFVVRSGGTTYEMGYDGTTRTPWRGFMVLRNDAVAITVRLIADFSNGKNIGGAGTLAGASYCNIDLTVRRGGIAVEGRLTDPSSTGVLGWGLFRSSAETGVDITSGVEASAADGSGNKYRVYLPAANTVDTTNGGAYIDSAATSMSFGVGNDRTLLTGHTISGQYFAAMNHRLQVAAR